MLDDVWKLMDSFVHSGDFDSSAFVSDPPPDHHWWEAPSHASSLEFQHQPGLHGLHTSVHPNIVGYDDANGILGAHHGLASHTYGGQVVAGDPQGAAHYWHVQEGMNSCAVACQTDILHSFGIDVPEHEVALVAQEHGWYDPVSGIGVKIRPKFIGTPIGK